MRKNMKKISIVLSILVISILLLFSKKVHAATEDYGPFEHSIVGARAWSTYSGKLNLREDHSKDSKLIAELSQGQKMQIIGGIVDNYVKVKVNQNDKIYYGYVFVEYIMINLPDIMPSLEYNITNATSSIYTCDKYDIPDVTGVKLYPNAKYIKKSIFYNVDTLENKVHFKDPAEKDVNECYAPLKYDAALKLNKAYQSAKNDGYNIKIYDSYRPYSVTKSIYNKFKIVAEANDERGEDMRNAMNKDGLNIDWFLAANKSAHNYGIALDLTLTKNGEEINAQTKMHQLDASAAISNNNDETNKLQEYMTSAGFITLKSEWWHFQDGRTDAQYVSGNYCDFQVE